MKQIHKDSRFWKAFEDLRNRKRRDTQSPDSDANDADSDSA